MLNGSFSRGRCVSSSGVYGERVINEWRFKLFGAAQWWIEWNIIGDVQRPQLRVKNNPTKHCSRLGVFDVISWDILILSKFSSAVPKSFVKFHEAIIQFQLTLFNFKVFSANMKWRPLRITAEKHRKNTIIYTCDQMWIAKQGTWCCFDQHQRTPEKPTKTPHPAASRDKLQLGFVVTNLEEIHSTFPLPWLFGMQDVFSSMVQPGGVIFGIWGWKKHLRKAEKMKHL